MSARIRCLALLFCGLVALADDLSVEEHETITRSFPAVKSLDIDNFDGFIHLTGSSAKEIELEIQKTIRARSGEKIQEVKREVTLDLGERDATVQAYVDGPFRCKCGDGSINYRGSRFYGYEVRFDFTVKVPRETNVRLRTVNHGDIVLQSTSGSFDVDNINGGVELADVAGSGRAHALNRPLRVSFRSNPTGACDFGSLNGDVDVTFQPDLAADLRLKTFNGGAYTDFDVTPMPVAAGVAERRDGKFVYKSNGFAGVRVGAGGPEISFDTLNGDIRIHKRGN